MYSAAGLVLIPVGCPEPLVHQMAHVPESLVPAARLRRTATNCVDFSTAYILPARLPFATIQSDFAWDPGRYGNHLPRLLIDQVATDTDEQLHATAPNQQRRAILVVGSAAGPCAPMHAGLAALQAKAELIHTKTSYPNKLQSARPCFRLCYCHANEKITF